MKLEAGTFVRDYEILNLISDSGGMGVVYLAKEKLLGRLVALKAIKLALMADSQFSQRFLNEALIQSRLRHPNIVSLIAFFEDGGNNFMVMEYCEGITLRELIARTGPIPEQRALHIFSQIARALDYSHNMGVIHRDVKPSNVIINTQEQDEIKMMDFGIAKLLSDQHQTQTGSFLGTPNYMSPEQIVSPKSVDHRSDIFSAGILLYEMLTGRLPYDSTTDSDFALQQQIVQNELVDPRNYYPHISAWVVDFVYALCRKDREQRYQSMGQVSAYLEQQKHPAQAIRPIETPSVQIPKPQVEEEISPTDIKKKGQSLAFAWVGLALIAIVILAVIYGYANKPRADDISQGIQLAQRRYENAANPMPAYAPQMVFVRGGGFYMGHQHTVLADERPVHWVNLNSFYIGKYEISLAEFVEVMNYKPFNDSEGKMPARNLSWFEAIEYCNRLSVLCGFQPAYSINGNSSPASWRSGTIQCDFSANGYRLPTEAEWEFAAREGKSELHYNHSGSNNIDEVGWYLSNKAIDPLNVDRYDLHPSPVGRKKANSLGVYDMTGNVWEWVWDRYSRTYYSQSPENNPKGPEQGNSRVLRGGAFDSEPGFSYVSTRGLRPPDTKHRSYGFRVCRTRQ